MANLDTNVFTRLSYDILGWAVMSPDVRYAGFSVTVTPGTPSRYGQFRFQYRENGWYFWDEGWFALADFAGNTGIQVEIAGGSVDLLDPDFSEIEVSVREAGEYSDADPSWPEISDTNYVTQRLLRGITANLIPGSKIACVDAEEMLNETADTILPLLSQVDRTISEMDEISDYSTDLVDGLLTVSFTTYDGYSSVVTLEIG